MFSTSVGVTYLAFLVWQMQRKDKKLILKARKDKRLILKARKASGTAPEDLQKTSRREAINEIEDTECYLQ